MPRAMWVAAGLALACSVVGGDASAQDSQQPLGVASYYSENYTSAVASGPLYDPNQFTAAHRTLPFGTRLRVTDSMTSQRGRGRYRSRTVYRRPYARSVVRRRR